MRRLHQHEAETLSDRFSHSGSSSCRHSRSSAIAASGSSRRYEAVRFAARPRARTVGLITSQAQVTSGSTPQLSKVGVRRTQTGGSPKADSGAALGGGASLHEQMGAARHLSKTRLRFTARRTTAGDSLATSVPRHYPVLGLGHYPSPVQRTSPVTHGLAP